jgi:signal transduction histidine kinase
MKEASLEPGLLSAFRFFTILRLGVILPTALVHSFLNVLPVVGDILPLQHFQETHPTPLGGYSVYLLGFSFADALLIVAYLWWSPCRRGLGRFFLPGGLLLSSVVPIVEQYLRTTWLDSAELPALGGAWQLVVVLFIPLVLIGWQYNFRAVLLFCLGTALLDEPLTIMAASGIAFDARPMMILILARTILYLAVGYMICRMMAAQRQQRQALAQANAQLSHYAATLEQLSVSRERNRLARELHDTLAHTLSGVTVQLEAVNALWNTDAKAAHAILTQSLETTRTGLTETRRALQALRTSPVEDLGLALALRNLAESLTTRTGLALDLRLPDDLDDLGPAVEQCVYRVAQEALANVDRHASARRLSVQLDRQDQQLILTIADDGRGFAPNAALPEDQFGLKGMQERAEIAGGKLEVESCPGGGTTVRLNVPVCGCGA